MKGLRVLVIVFVLIGVLGFGSMIYLLNFKQDQNHFGEELLKYTDITRDYWKNVTVEYQGKTYQIEDSDQVYQLYFSVNLGGTTRRLLLFHKNYDTDSVAINFGDTAKITVTKIPEDVMEDGVIMKYENYEKGKTTYYRVKKVKMFEHILDVFYNEKEE